MARPTKQVAFSNNRSGGCHQAPVKISITWDTPNAAGRIDRASCRHGVKARVRLPRTAARNANKNQNAASQALKIWRVSTDDTPDSEFRTSHLQVPLIRFDG